MHSDAIQNDVNQSADIRHGLGHLDVLEEFFGLNKMQDGLHHIDMLNDMKQSQKLSRPPSVPSDAPPAPFCMDSKYPSSQFVRAFAHSTYHYPYLRTMWLQFCRCRGLTRWSEILPSTIRCFLPGSCVPFVKRPFEWEIRGSVNLTNFCFVLLVTWRHRLRFSCHLRQNIVARNVFEYDVLPCW